MKNVDVVALGELLIDFTESGVSEQGNPVLEANPGGAPCNVLAMLAKLGYRTAFIGKVGQDRFGLQLKEVAEEAGIGCEGLVIDPNVRTTLAFVKTFPNGDRDFSFYRNPGADMMLTEEEVKKDLIASAKIFHFGTLSMTHEGVRKATMAAVGYAKENGALLSFDPNLRPPLWTDPEDARRQMEWGLSVCDILKIADNEAAFLTGTEDLTEAAAILSERYPQIRILNVTAGEKGSLHYTDGDAVFVPALTLGGTIETTGAGDTFCACVLHYVLTHGTGPFERTQREEMLRFANAAAYLVTTKKGAIRSMPSIKEIEEVL